MVSLGCSDRKVELSLSSGGERGHGVMSTFNGVVKEFPEIRIDHFRPQHSQPSPLACFLSHVHSDHLAGLESFRSPFVYCSAATREILLRLEKYPHRLNFSKGILESRRVTYKHLKTLLRPIPLNTPTTVELCPGKTIRVTLLDANHCPGAVMFLIEAWNDSADAACVAQGQHAFNVVHSDSSSRSIRIPASRPAILYSGDTRADASLISALRSSPILSPYLAGLLSLQTIYLDTTFATKGDIYRAFPPKSAGIQELQRKVIAYPPGTVFHITAWTFGYEEVFVALSSLLGSKIHVDSYKLRLYRALRAGAGVGELMPQLAGFQLGNAWHDGCLTEDMGSQVHLHACEPGHGCDVLKAPGTVRIVPIVNRLQGGEEVPESGTGGGGGDLFAENGRLQLDLRDQNIALSLLKLCTEIKDETQRKKAVDHIMGGIESESKKIELDVSGEGDKVISLKRLTELLAVDLSPIQQPTIHFNNAAERELNLGCPFGGSYVPNANGSTVHEQTLPREIRFPYSRHSSYDELCDLVELFEPKDIHPCCVVNSDRWDPSLSMQNLFGHLCSGKEFLHDREMMELYDKRMEQVEARDGYNVARESTPSSQPAVSSQDADRSDKSGGVRSAAHCQDGQANTPFMDAQTQVTRNAPRSRRGSTTGSRSQLKRPGSRSATPTRTRPSESTNKKRRPTGAATIGQQDTLLEGHTSSLTSSGSCHPTAPSSRPEVFHTAALDGPERASRKEDARASIAKSTADHQKQHQQHQQEPAEGPDQSSSQVTVSDAQFDSQRSVSVGAASAAEQARKLERRKEAYRAALGRGPVDWHEYSTLSLEAEELEL